MSEIVSELDVRSEEDVVLRSVVVHKIRVPHGSVPLKRPRMGHIEFLNCLPLYWGLARTGSLVGLEMTVASPEWLSDALATDRLDIGPISTFEFLRHAEDLTALSGIAVGCNGPVMSCLIVSTVPLEDLDGATVALGNTSRTSVQLAQLLLREAVGVRCRYVTCSPDVDAMLRVAAAAVIIGDVALIAASDAARRGHHVYDLGQMWHDWTGLPFVFAVFAARRSFLDTHPEMVRAVHRDLLAARDVALEEIDEFCREIALWETVDEATLRRYYTAALDFSFDQPQRDGVAEFARRVGGPAAGFVPDVGFRVLELEQPPWRSHQPPHPLA
ncbi:menaquinone biosynthetic enzyme MqnA/MqnD family protein [Nocardia sp. CA-084685]|uniref:menaquinone biosynthetic enzyme MqnA/MqnD family protein n=1 Tax=Nocardia sp. CA-084685 TaxID=3239970 RepID=UPI003D95BA8C